MAIFIVATIAACSGAQTLRTTADASAFARDQAETRDISWQLASDASPEARRAWRERRSMAETGRRLRQEWQWGCIALVRLVRGEPYTRVTFTAEQEQADISTANELVLGAHRLGRAALAGVKAAVCKGHHPGAEKPPFP
jgi:hypothetical protein